MVQPFIEKQADVTESERELVERVKAGDTDAFHQLYERYARIVYRFCQARVGDHHDAEDLAAETFVKAWRGFRSFEWREHTPLSAWLFRIAHNLIVDHYRRQRDVSAWLPWRHSQAEQEFSRVDDQDEIRRAFAALTYEQQMILHLHFFEDRTADEIAQFVGKSANAVRVAQFRALQRLNRALKHDKA